jgi:mevalonate kinase
VCICDFVPDQEHFSSNVVNSDILDASGTLVCKVMTTWTIQKAPSKHVILELALGFAQTSGQFTLDPVFVRSPMFDSLKHKVMYRPPGSKVSGAGGGGSLGNTESETNQGIRTFICIF